MLTLPTAGLALFAFIGPLLVRRTSEEGLVLAGSVTVLAGDVARLSGGSAGFLVGTTLIAIGTGVITSVIPGLVKRNYPDRVALVMAAYSAVLTLGAAGAAALAPAVAERLGWSASMSVAVCTVGPVGFATFVWWLVIRRNEGAGRCSNVPGTNTSMRVWRMPLSWWVTGYFAATGLVYYVLLNWMPTLARSRGMNPADAGATLAVMSVAQIAGAFLIPILIGRHGDQRAMTVLIAVPQIAGLMAFASIAAPAGLWIGAVILGVGLGAGFSLSMTFIGLRAGDEFVALRLSAMTQGVGYAVAATGPSLAGLLHDAFHGWTAVIIAVIGVIAVAVGAGLRAGVSRSIGDDMASAVSISTTKVHEERQARN